MPAASPQPNIVIACGGTGGHLFPGLAVADALRQRGCDVLLLVSPKEVDQLAIQNLPAWPVATLPAVALTRGRLWRFLGGFVRSYAAARRLFRDRRPHAVLGMGGFTSAPPVLAGRACGAAAFLHESNSVPGRANRWLARWVHQAYVGFPQAAARLRGTTVVSTGTPVRPQFTRLDAATSREALGLDPHRPVLLVTGGSQGAHAINQLLIDAAPQLAHETPELQVLHLAGTQDADAVRDAYARHALTAQVHGFLPDMPHALGAATLAVSRAGASSLAELAAARLPVLLIPYPSAADDHQYSNARALAETGAALLRTQAELTPRSLAVAVIGLLRDPARRQTMQDALAHWESPRAAQTVAETMLAHLRSLGRLPAPCPTPAGNSRAAGQVRPPSSRTADPPERRGMDQPGEPTSAPGNPAAPAQAG
ncbi:MAG: undecaprenyldiphospho-muramoylpentapeptide beta-N-acetylglucosaminyltransferase [Verrucomicrobia bacterium]|nr:undecaprenyldiphospho-muramoylpentapeptide beta-N-acetylglucosaminyltransferase [Verrucomicrobiota bacterium]